MLAAMIMAGVFALLAPDVQAELQSCGVGAAELERQLELPYRAFDQDFTGGWRAVSAKPGCDRAAGELTAAYLQHVKLESFQARIVRWHAGQTFADAGDLARALSFFQQAYDQDLDRGRAWNLYVDGTIAFVRADRAALDAATDALAAMPVSEEEIASRRQFLADNPNVTMPAGFLTEPQNLSVLQNFQRCWGKSYKEAYHFCRS